MQLDDLEAIADVVAQAIQEALGPALERLAVVEARLADLNGEGDVLAALGPFRERLAVAETKVAALETRPLVAGPPGEPGAAGKDGADGKDGTAGLSFEGVYQAGQPYEKGQLVTWAGASWHCNGPTTSKPGESKDWTLMVKRGQDGRDGKDAPGALPIVAVGGSR